METYDNQRAPSVLSLTQETFEEIRLLYTTFSRNPSDGRYLLRDFPPTTQSLKDKYDRLERLEENPCKGPSKVDFFDIYRVPDENLLIPSDKVRIWLHRNRIAAILQKHLPHLPAELGRVTDKARTILLQEYRKTLERLLVQLNKFEGLTAGNFPELATDTTVNWTEIYGYLNNYISTVRHVIEQYKGKIDIWLDETPDTLPPPARKEPKRANNVLYNDSQKQQFVRSILAPLSDLNPSKDTIMSRVDFERLITYTDHLVLKDNLPAEFSPIVQKNMVVLNL